MFMTPPNGRNNGNAVYQLYWCFRCNRTVRMRLGNTVLTPCPYCLGQLYEIHLARPWLVVDFTEFDLPPEDRLLEALSLISDRRTRRHDLGFDGRGNRFRDVGVRVPWPAAEATHPAYRLPRRRTHGFDESYDWLRESLIRPRPPRRQDDGIRRRRSRRPIPRFDDSDELDRVDGIPGHPRSYVILTPAGRLPVRPNFPPEIMVPPWLEPWSFMDVSEEMSETESADTLSDLIEHIPPAPESEIDALPTILVGPIDLELYGSDCAVCREPFVVGEEVRVMPCNHIFHYDCIAAWLRRSNSCPVCRRELPVPSGSGVDADDESGGIFQPLLTLESQCPFCGHVHTLPTQSDVQDGHGEPEDSDRRERRNWWCWSWRRNNTVASGRSYVNAAVYESLGGAYNWFYITLLTRCGGTTAAFCSPQWRCSYWKDLHQFHNQNAWHVQ